MFISDQDMVNGSLHIDRLYSIMAFYVVDSLRYLSDRCDLFQMIFI